MSEEGNSAKKSFVSNFNKRNNHSTTVSHISSKDASREITHLDNTPVRKLHKKSPSASNMAHKLGNIKVVCRIRPLNKKEKDLKDAMILEVTDEKTLTYKNPIPYQGSPSYQFTFDRVFGSDSAQQDIYEAVSRPIVESAFEGFNGTILTYGQTGSGKTYTMQGLINERNPETDGIMPRMAYHIFDHMKDAAEGAQPVVKFSAIELYSEKIKDLLKPEKTSLKIRQDKSKGISIEDLTEIVPSKKDELLELFKTSVLNRSHPGTSSKSHMIVMITISQSNIQDLSGKSGKICMADLADYEKMSKASHDTRMTTSAKLVNKSLCTLGNIIKLLSESRNNLHIPYRESNLTRILQDSLGGNSRTALLITCSPSRADYLETLQTLKFGMRARLVNNTVKLNTEMTIPALQKLLAKSEKENEEKGRRISVLENMLKENGLFVNVSNRDDNSHFEENKSDILKGNNAPSIMGELEYHPESELLEPEDEFLNKTLSSFSDIAPDIDENEFEEEENVLELQKSLEEEQKKSREHADRNEELMRELEEVKQKLFEAENDNKALTRKLALTNMKVQGFELRVKQRDEQIEKLEGFRTDLLEENRELQRKVDYYMELLKTEEESVEQLNNISIQKELKELEQSMSQDSISQKSDMEKDEGELKIEGVISRMAKTISLRFGVKEQKDIDSLSTTLLERFKNLLELQGKTDAKRETELTLEVENLKQDNENLRKEVDLHKDKYEVLLKDFEGILRDYEDVARGRFPLFDQMLQSMVKAALTKARNSFEDEKNILMKGIQDKIMTLKNMENRLEKEQGRHRSLQHKLDEGQKENVQILKNMQNQISSKLSPSDMPKRAQTVKEKEKDGSGIKQKDLKLEVTKAILKDFGSLKNSLRKQSNSGNKENENIMQSSASKTPAEILERKPVLASSATLKPNRNKNKRFTVNDVDFTQRKNLNSLKRKLDFDDETH